jgi:hypothetical protein
VGRPAWDTFTVVRFAVPVNVHRTTDAFVPSGHSLTAHVKESLRPSSYARTWPVTQPSNNENAPPILRWTLPDWPDHDLIERLLVMAWKASAGDAGRETFMVNRGIARVLCSTGAVIESDESDR